MFFICLVIYLCGGVVFLFLCQLTEANTSDADMIFWPITVLKFLIKSLIIVLTTW